MSMPWTITKFIIRWRIKHWAVSCFLACRVPLDKEPPQLQIKNMVSEIKDDKRTNTASKKLSRQNRCNKERLDIAQGRNKVALGGKCNESSWPSFQDEDYIVFCFREDGAFDVVKDCKSESMDRFDSASKSPRPVNRKLKYGEVSETGSQGKRSNAHGANDSCLKNGEGINPFEEGEEEQCSYLDIKSPSVASTRSYKLEEIENNQGTVSLESNDSNQSDSSTGSFTFPVLHWEPMGSPVQMPKSQGLYIRKHKVSFARFQCCRF